MPDLNENSNKITHINELISETKTNMISNVSILYARNENIEIMEKNGLALVENVF
jgi:hypothetical protein